MKVYTYSEARQNFASVLKIAVKDGEVKIQKKDGTMYTLKPDTKKNESPFPSKRLKLNISNEEILSAIRESRER